jgi:hypothetical protein
MNTKGAQNVPNCHKISQTVRKIFQMATNYFNSFPSQALKICPNWDFWFENNKRSGNPAAGVDVSLFIDVPFCNPAL